MVVKAILSSFFISFIPLLSKPYFIEQFKYNTQQRMTENIDMHQFEMLNVVNQSIEENEPVESEALNRGLPTGSDKPIWD